MLSYYHLKTLKNQIYKTVIVPGILFGCLNMAIYSKKELLESKLLRLCEG
jgi:hypothetical protein